MMTGEAVMDSVLVASGVSVNFGGIVALDRVDLEVGRGRIVGLIGPNGAGKTTFIDTVNGFLTPSSGSVTLDGKRIDGFPVSKRAAHGLGRTFQSAEIFEDLTVRENLLVAAEKPGILKSLAGCMGYRPPREVIVDEMLARFGLEELSARPPSALSLGQRKLVTVAAALCVRPKVVLLDEPAAGLDAAESRELGVQLRRVCNEGVGLLLVDHDMSLILQVCDYVYVLQFGRIIASGHPDVVRTDPKVVEAYLGQGSGHE